jgi:hypothetical protein
MTKAQLRAISKRQAEEAALRLAAFDRLPKPLRDKLNAVPVKPDTETVIQLYRDARRRMTPEKAQAWMADSIDSWVRQKVGPVPPLEPRRPPRAVSRRLSPQTHKLAPAVAQTCA